jgi:hypothetical protein
MELAELVSDGLRKTTSGRMKAIKVFFNIVLNPPTSRLIRLPDGESWNISHEHIGEVKEILKKLRDDPFGMR